MSDLHHPARRDGGHDGTSAREHGLARTISGAGPVRPEEGSPLDLLLRRQVGSPAAGRLLGFVPAQVR